MPRKPKTPKSTLQHKKEKSDTVICSHTACEVDLCSHTTPHFRY